MTHDLASISRWMHNASATRWLAGISTGTCLYLFVTLGGQCTELRLQRQMCAERMAHTLEVQAVLLRTLDTTTMAIDASSRVVDRVSRIDYFMEQGQAMEAFRVQLTADLELDRPVELAIGGCE